MYTKRQAAIITVIAILYSIKNSKNLSSSSNDEDFNPDTKHVPTSWNLSFNNVLSDNVRNGVIYLAEISD